MGKTKAKAPAKRQAVKDVGSALELLKMANKVDLQLYAAKGGSLNRKTRALIAIEKIIGGARPLEEINAIQAARHGGMITDDQAFAFIAIAAQNQALADKEIERLSRAIDAKRAAAGLGEDDDWPGDEIPEDVGSLHNEWTGRFLQLKVAILRHHEENEMADLLLHDPDAYQDRLTKGWQSVGEKK